MSPYAGAEPERETQFNSAITVAVDVITKRANQLRASGDPRNGPGVIETELRKLARELEKAKRK